LKCSKKSVDKVLGTGYNKKRFWNKSNWQNHEDEV